MEQTLHLAKDQAVHCLMLYGYWAAAPALLLDATGVPWLWIALMLMAEKAGKDIYLLLLIGIASLTIFDHALYWIGYKGGRPVIKRLAMRFPRVYNDITEAECAMRGRGIWIIALGRFVPVVGRCVGVAAGLMRVPYARFATYDAIGVGITVIGFGLLASFVGEKTFDKPWFPAALALIFMALVGTVVLVAVAGCWRRLHCVKQSKRELEEPADIVAE